MKWGLRADARYARPKIFQFSRFGDSIYRNSRVLASPLLNVEHLTFSLCTAAIYWGCRHCTTRHRLAQRPKQTAHDTFPEFMTSHHYFPWQIALKRVQMFVVQLLLQHRIINVSIQTSTIFWIQFERYWKRFFRKLVRMIADNDSHDFLTISESTKDLTCHCHRYGDLVL